MPLAHFIARKLNCRRQLDKLNSHAYSHCRRKYLNFSVSLKKFLLWQKLKRPGTARVGAISKAQKQQKDFKVSSIRFYSTRMRKKLKKNPKFYFEIFFKIFLVSGKSHKAEKCKRGPQKSLINLYFKCQ